MTRPEGGALGRCTQWLVLLLGLTALAPAVTAADAGAAAPGAGAAKRSEQTPGASAPDALEAMTSPPLTESLELTLELARHERLAAQKADSRNRLAAFTTDGCSGGLSAAWDAFASWIGDFGQVHGKLPPWQPCCVDHDRLYHAAGARDATPRESFDARRAADLALRQCVLSTGVERTPALAGEYGLSQGQVAALYRAIADLMYRSVRLGGIPCSALPWRWGYGWPHCD